MSLSLRVNGLEKKYDGNTVFNGLSVSFEKDLIHVLMGSNGSGKSTFLRICALLEEPDKGEIIFFNGEEALRKNIALRRRITLVLPKIGIFNASVYNNIAYGLRIRGMHRDEIHQKVRIYLESFGLTGREKQNALTLSSGEAQRLGIARAMVTEPEILFLDEPTASVDEKNSRLIEEIILNMRSNGGLTVIMTTHDMGQAQRLSGRLLLIKDKKILPHPG